MPLSFFSNSGNGYGSAIPFQRIVEPAQLGMFLNLEQAELLRIQRYNEGWRFYFGKHWMFKRDDGEPLITLNFFRKFIDKAVEFLVAKGFQISVPECLEQVTKPFLDEVWEYNKRDQAVWDYGTTGAVTGDVFVLITYEEPSPMQKKVNPFSQGQVRVHLLGSEQVYPTWDPLDQDTLIAVRIETVFYAERGTRELTREEHANHDGRQLYTKRFTQIITRDQIIEQYHGEQPVVRVNLLGEIPLVHIKNISLPKEYYGLPDGMDIIDPQRELNEKATDVSDIINYHATPTTIVFGAKAKQLDKSAKQLWTGLPKDARVETLKLEGDLTAARGYMDFIKKTMHELSDTPEGALGSMQPISNTSGVALHMQYQPLLGKTKRKKAQYEAGLQQINYFILRIGTVTGLVSLPFDLCRSCGGRIIEVETGKTTRQWDANMQRFIPVPVKKKRCYHIDEQTLDFLDPYEMRIKYWRQYGFGSELKDMTLRQILMEITEERQSFWDYTIAQKQVMEQWRKKNADLLQQAHAAATQNVAPQAPPNELGQEQPQAPGAGQPIVPDALMPKIMVAPPKIEPPPALRVVPLPDGEIDLPEEPEQVTVAREWLSPDTGAVVEVTEEEMFLVPTGCRKPAYLNPFQNKVEFQDVLPKDEALQAQLYQMYQTANWVDEEWVQERIPEIAAHASDIRKRMKAKRVDVSKMKAAQVQEVTPGQEARTTTYMGELAPQVEPPGQVPGPGGNPISVANQMGG